MMLVNYLKRVGSKRILIMLVGNIFLGMGVSIFKLAGLGNDAYNGMLMALAAHTPLSYGNFFAVFSGCLFLFQLIAGRKYIGIGTIVNTFLLGYVVTFFYQIWIKVLTAPTTLWLQLVEMVIGVFICSLGISLYQTPDVGVSPYDSLSLLMAAKLAKVPYFWCRMFTDGLCALVCFLAGGLVGLGTLAAALGLGPFIHFFNVHITNKILAAQK